MTGHAKGVKFENSSLSHCSIYKTWMKRIFYNTWTLERILLISFQYRFYEMCFNTISGHCNEMLNLKWAMPTDIIGIHWQTPRTSLLLNLMWEEKTNEQCFFFYHSVSLLFCEWVICCTWDIFHIIIVINLSYHIVARKVVQRRLGKSPAKSFVQELNLQKKYHIWNAEELIIPKRK